MVAGYYTNPNWRSPAYNRTRLCIISTSILYVGYNIIWYDYAVVNLIYLNIFVLRCGNPNIGIRNAVHALHYMMFESTYSNHLTCRQKQSAPELDEYQQAVFGDNLVPVFLSELDASALVVRTWIW